MKDLFDKVGIDVETIKSGNLKDSGSFSRNTTPQDKIFLKEVPKEFSTSGLDSITY